MFPRHYNSKQMLKGYKFPKEQYIHGGVATGPIGASDNVTKEFLQWCTKEVSYQNSQG